MTVNTPSNFHENRIMFGRFLGVDAVSRRMFLQIASTPCDTLSGHILAIVDPKPVQVFRVSVFGCVIGVY